MTRFLSTILLLTLAAGAQAADGHPVDKIYRLFLADQIDAEAIEKAYAEDIIHVGRESTPLLRGREMFLQTNILPLAAMVNAGHAKVGGRFYIVRRVEGEELLNDVGYLYARVEMEGQATIEQLQKFSWVFRKGEDGVWRVITDFDATPADLSMLSGIEATLVIGD
jgi:ketosteroid isomerase-like protein